MLILCSFPSLGMLFGEKATFYNYSNTKQFNMQRNEIMALFSPFRTTYVNTRCVFVA